MGKQQVFAPYLIMLMFLFWKHVWRTHVRMQVGASQGQLRSGDIYASVALASRENNVNTVRTGPYDIPGLCIA